MATSHSRVTTVPPGRKPVLLSVVVPCYNEQDVLQDFQSRLSHVLDQTALTYEIIYVNDGSRDNTLSVLRQIQADDDHVRVVSFARNFGHQLAVTAGVDFAVGQAVVLIDADLQDPPELIEAMIQEWQNGSKVIYGVRESRTRESAFKLITAKSFYRLINLISEIEIPLDAGDFRLMDRCVVDVLKSMPERDRFVRGMVSWIGFKQTPLYYARHERAAGKTKYSLSKMVRFALDAIVSFSVAPLRIALLFGLMFGMISGVALVSILAKSAYLNKLQGGLELSLVSVLFIGSLILSCLGIIGEYVGRIYRELKRRPLYVISETRGFHEQSASAAA